MSRLIVVSNRVPDPRRPAAGGLATALTAALQARGGIWMGWSGECCDDDTEPQLRQRQAGAVTYAVTDLSARDNAEYYQGFANSVLWPLCHYRLGLTDYARKDAAGYWRVNRLFAGHLLPLLRKDDVLWVHDYHLLPLAAELRLHGVTNPIGFFMHIPWPAPDVFLSVPGSDALLSAMTGYDLLGFQTENDTANFAQCLARSRIARPLPGDPGRLATRQRSFRAGTFPISIDTAGFARTAEQAVRNPAMRRLQETLRGQRLILGVDRLDYSKGIPQRIEGYRRFLLDRPAFQGQVTYLQITPKSRAGVEQYEALQREIAEQAGHLAGELGRLDWAPMRYVNRSFGQSVLAGTCRMARAALVTPLRDGMNLVAKEYVAAQELDEGALLVNPYDVEAIAGALGQAMDMAPEERRERHGAMLRVLQDHTVFDWCDSFLSALSAPGAAQAAAGTAEPRRRIDIRLAAPSGPQTPGNGPRPSLPETA